ncbi:hypothetical protein MYAM1_001561 [Malassezia yamatoensis]|uniref:N-acetyltransferase domain-containing protein n=1 Tax=Malassezia yamatoensis TaxID=253288 RepID=A0AAJ5YTB2_9BASI|nr:hypothetical protein MYAM1_001561 [Malassezia yamatoensis]
MEDNPDFAVDATPAKLPTSEPIRGELISLVPLKEEHDQVLFDTVGAPSKHDLWRFIPIGPFHTLEEFKTQMNSFRTSETDQIFVVISNDTQTVLGSLALINIRCEHRVAEIGYVLFGHQMQRTKAGTEALYLLLRTAFDQLHYRRIEWKCNNQHEKSKRAAQRYGFVPEGVHRQHFIIRGHNRDTAWFSILDKEWPSVRTAFQKWLDPSNFDADGNQLHTLVELRPSPN